MDKIANYQQIIIQFLQTYAQRFCVTAPTLQQQVIADCEHNHFMLVSLGWEPNRFTHDTIFHLDIIGGKIWIQQNWTDILVADELMEMGVEKMDIVLGFIPEYARPYSGFATC